MILLYFKQAWNLIRQEKLFSSIYIIGTGLSITVVMVLSIVFYIRMANIYPETNRDRMLIAKSAVQVYNKMDWSSALSLNLIDNCFRNVKGVESLSVMRRDNDEHYLQHASNKEQIPVIVKYIDTEFWKIFNFRFLHGQPFTESDFQSGIKTAVISESMAKKLFNRTDVTGNHISLDFLTYRIAGVVKDVSYVTGRTYGDLWVPYTVSPEYNHTDGGAGLLGEMEACFLVLPGYDLNVVRQEVIDNVKRYAGTFDDLTFNMHGQPDKHWQSTFRFWSNVGPDFKKIAWQYGIIFLILLLVPAISLSGMTDSRMERRLSEMGIRRAFGAPVKNLMGQIISENFIFTFLGAVAGLLLSYILILLSANWIMSIGQTFVDIPPEGTKVMFSPSMLINIPVFMITVLVCFMLNLMTALIPAWRASHKEIIYSLNAQQ